MTNTDRDPRDEIDQRAQQQEAPQARHQEVIGSSTALAEQSLSVDLAGAEIDRLIATAHRFPRDPDVVERKLKAIVLRNEAAAENAVYALPRAGKAIVGPSIGFATAAADAFGNCWDDAYLLHIDRVEKVVMARGVFMNWENNRRTTIAEPRRIVDSRGKIYNDDMILVTSKAAQSVAVRNAILRGISRTLWFPIYEAALYMVRGSEQTLVDRRSKAVAALANFGVDPKKIFLFLGVRGLDEIGIEHLPTLRGMFASLRDGTVTVEEMFDPRRMSDSFERVKNPLADEGDDEDDAGDEPPPPAAGATVAGAQQAGQAASATETAKERPSGQGEQGQGPAAASEPGATGGKAKPAGKPKPDSKAKAGPAPQGEPQQEQPGPEKPAAPAAPPPPKTCAEYRAHAEAYINGATSAGDLENQWKRERDLRTTCSVVEDDFTFLFGAYKAKLAALRGE